MDALRWVGAFLAVLAVGYLVFESFQASRERRAARARERERERQRAEDIARSLERRANDSVYGKSIRDEAIAALPEAKRAG